MNLVRPPVTTSTTTTTPTPNIVNLRVVEKGGDGSARIVILLGQKVVRNTIKGRLATYTFDRDKLTGKQQVRVEVLPGQQSKFDHWASIPPKICIGRAVKLKPVNECDPDFKKIRLPKTGVVEIDGYLRAAKTKAAA